MYYDLLAKIRNAEQAKKEAITTSSSKLDFSVAKILAQEGYLSDVQKKNVGRKEYLEIKLARGKRSPVISGYKITSKPSRRIYIQYQDLRPVKQGYGLSVVSTSRGVMSGKEAKKQKVGGEYLFEIW